MVVHNISKISGDKAFQSLLQVARRATYKNFIYISLLMALGLPLMIVGLVQKNSSYISMGGVVLALSLAFVVYCFFMLLNAPKDIKKKNPEVTSEGVTYEFFFKGKSVDVVISNAGKKKKANYEYYDFRIVYEYVDHYEIRLETREVLICLKDGFEGDKEKMIEFFKQNLSTNKKLKIVNKMPKAK